jgi:energy-coupling factor transport system ATP-binding protein
MEDVVRVADRLLVLCMGELLIDGAPHEVFRQEELLTRAGLELPESFKLLAALREKGYSINVGSTFDSESLKQVLLKILRGE